MDINTLCVDCGSQMKIATATSDRGAMTIDLRCPVCLPVIRAAEGSRSEPAAWSQTHPT
jgi:hypothetical protein